MSLQETVEAIALSAFDLHNDETTQPNSTDDPESLYDKLLKLRSLIDRVNTLLLQCLTMQNKARQSAVEAKNDHDDAWNEAAAKGHVQEYSSAKEREAAYSVQTIDLKIKLRRAEKTKADLDYLVEYLKTAQRGMDGRRRDLDSLVRARAAAQALEY